MYTEALEQWVKMSKNFIPTAKTSDWDKTAAEMCQRVAQQNLEFLGENFSRFSEQLARLSSVKKPEDFFKECMNAQNEDISAAVKYTQDMVRTSMENMEELTDLFTSFRESALSTTKSSERSSGSSERSSSR